MIQSDTKAAWKRRALKAEAELESLRKVMAFTAHIEMDAHRKLAAATVALKEIAESVAFGLGNEPC